MSDPTEKIKTAIGNIFSENNNKALTVEELVDLVIHKISNGELDGELIQIIIGGMINEFELMQRPDGKVVPYQFP